MASALSFDRSALTTPGAELPRGWSQAERWMARYERALERATAEPGPLGTALAHHFERPGKQTRARLALASAAALGVPRARAVQLALACELLHNASLVHDDLQDRDATRRGHPALWARFGPELAINVGDFLLTRAVDAAASIPLSGRQSRELVRCFTSRTLAVIRGQIDDNRSGDDPTLSVEHYLDIAAAKTGPLLSLPVEGSLILADAEASHRERARQAMALLGTAYQVQDDLADLFGLKDRDEIAGDLRHGRLSAPVVHYLSRAIPAERERFRRFRAGGDASRGVEGWIARLRNAASTRATIELARSLCWQGRARLAGLPDALAEVLDLTAARMTAPLERIEAIAAQADAKPRVPLLPPKRAAHEAGLAGATP